MISASFHTSRDREPASPPVPGPICSEGPKTQQVGIVAMTSSSTLCIAQTGHFMRRPVSRGSGVNGLFSLPRRSDVEYSDDHCHLVSFTSVLPAESDAFTARLVSLGDASALSPFRFYQIRKHSKTCKERDIEGSTSSK